MEIMDYRMDKMLGLTGKVVSGVEKAAFFTQLDWVQEQCMQKLGFKPYPGTLNIEIEEDDISIVEALKREEGFKLIPPDPNFCAATVLPVNIGGVKGAIVVPAENVNIHENKIVEVVAGLSLRVALDVTDGDVVTLVIEKSVKRSRDYVVS